ncbi:MAG: protein jag [Candidatus Saccharimonadales bacterium]
MTVGKNKSKVSKDKPIIDDPKLAEGTEEDLEKAIQFAKKYLEDLLSFLGLNTDVHASHDDDVIQLNVPTSRLNGFLIGQHGDNMRSIQFLVGSVLKNQNYNYSRVNVDIAGYKQQRADRLVRIAEDWIKQVKTSAQPMELRPMNASDRRIIHKVAGEAGLSTESIDEGRDRHIILKPAD